MVFQVEYLISIGINPDSVATNITAAFTDTSHSRLVIGCSNGESVSIDVKANPDSVKDEIAQALVNFGARRLEF